MGYFTIMNLPYWVQSSRDNVYTWVAYDQSVLDLISYEALVGHLIEDVKNSNSEMIELSDGYKAKLVFHSFAADNEAIKSRI